jgi:short-subunit dehydrogenase
MSKQISTFQNALITGASSGIGAAFARLLAEQGCNLTLVARRTERLVSMKETLEPRHSIRVNVLTADLSIPEDRTRVEDWIKAQLDLDILINNAGFGMRGRFDQIEINRHQNMIDLMLIAPIRLTHAALPGMLSRQHGAIINVASATAFFARQSGVTYRSTKSFLVSFSGTVPGIYYF